MAQPDFETPANIQEQQKKNQSLVPKSCLEVPKCIYTMQLVGWVSLRFLLLHLLVNLFGAARLLVGRGAATVTASMSLVMNNLLGSEQ